MSAIGNCPDLDALAALAREATAGEWEAAREANTYWTVMIRGDTPLLRYANECDAAYIAAANPAAILALIARVRELEARPPGGYSASDIYRILGDPRTCVTIPPMKEPKP